LIKRSTLTIFFKYGTEIELRVLENKGLLETFQSNDSGTEYRENNGSLAI